MTTLLVNPRAVATTALRVLIVDDNEPDLDMLSRLLHKEYGRAMDVEAVDLASLALERLEQQRFDVVIVDYLLPDENGLDLLQKIHAIRPDGITLLMSGQGNESIAAAAIKRGASDYLVKKDLSGDRLRAVIDEAFGAVTSHENERRQLSRLQRNQEEIDHSVRSLSHDMSANFMILEHSVHKLKGMSLSNRSPQFGEGVSHLEACLQESKRYLDDLKSLARTGSLPYQAQLVDLNEIVQDTLYELTDLLRIRKIRVTTSATFPSVWCHKARAAQIISNLIRNAIRHGCDPHTPEISVTTVQPRPGLSKALRWLRIFDNGPGIPPEYRRQVFLPGFRAPGAREEGSGMGLAIVRRTVEHYQGQIFVDPQTPAGTAFMLGLPFQATEDDSN